MFRAENRGSLRSLGFGTGVAVLLAVVFLAAGTVQAGQVVLGAGDFPYNASTGDTITLASGTVTIDGSGIQFWRVHDIVIDGDPDDDGVPDTLIFNAAGNGDDYALKMKYDSYYGYVHDVVVKDLVIKQFEHADPATGEGCEGITMTGSHDILFENVDVSVYTRNSRCVYNSSSIGNFRVHFIGGTYNNYSHQYTNRCHYYGAAIYLNTAHGDSGKVCYDPDEFSYYLRGVNVRNTHGQGIITGGKSVVVQCTVYTNHRNTIWDNCDWGEQGCIGEDGYELGTCQGSANPYGIGLVGGAPGSRIDSNYVRADTTWGGGRGILIENSTGAQSCWIQVTGNDVDVHEGADKVYGGGFSYTRALALREIDAGTIRYVHVFNNTFAVTGRNINYDTVAVDTMYAYEKGGEAAKLMFSYSEGEDGDGCHVIVEDNTFRAQSLDSGCQMAALYFRAWTMDSTVEIRNNTYETDVYSVVYETSDSPVLRSPVFKRLSPDYDSTTYHLDHSGNDWLSVGNEVIDPTYTDGADEIIELASTNGSEDITFKRTVNIYAQGADDSLVADAAVWAIDDYGVTRDSGNTYGSGMVSLLLPHRFESRTATDSTGYNDYTIYAASGVDSSTIPLTVSWDCADADTVSLELTSGDLPDGIGLADLTYAERTRHDFSANYDSFLVKWDVTTVDSGVTLVWATSQSATDSTTYPDSVDLLGPDNVCYYELGDEDSVVIYLPDSSTNGSGSPNYYLSCPEPGYLKLSWWTKLGDSWSGRQTARVFSHPGDPIAPASIDIIEDSTFWNYSGDDDSILVKVTTGPDAGDSLPESIWFRAQFGSETPGIPGTGYKTAAYATDSTYYKWFTITGAGTFNVTAAAASYNSNYEPSYSDTVDVTESLTQPAGGVSGPSSVALDSLVCDHDATEQDSVTVTITTASSTGDSIYWALSDTGYVTDSSDASIRDTVYTASTTHTIGDTLTGTEPYTAYLSVWVVEGGEYSTRSGASEFFGGAGPAPAANTSVKYKGALKFKGELKLK